MAEVRVEIEHEDAVCACIERLPKMLECATKGLPQEDPDLSCLRNFMSVVDSLSGYDVDGANRLTLQTAGLSCFLLRAHIVLLKYGIVFPSTIDEFLDMAIREALTGGVNGPNEMEARDNLEEIRLESTISALELFLQRERLGQETLLAVQRLLKSRTKIEIFRQTLRGISVENSILGGKLTKRQVGIALNVHAGICEDLHGSQVDEMIRRMAEHVGDCQGYREHIADFKKALFEDRLDKDIRGAFTQVLSTLNIYCLALKKEIREEIIRIYRGCLQ